MPVGRPGSEREQTLPASSTSTAYAPLRVSCPSDARLSGRDPREALGLLADEPERPAERHEVADEVQARRRRVLFGAVDERDTGLVEHAEVPDERLETGSEAGRRDDPSTSTESSVGEHRHAVVEALEPGDDLHRPS